MGTNQLNNKISQNGSLQGSLNFCNSLSDNRLRIFSDALKSQVYRETLVTSWGLRTCNGQLDDFPLIDPLTFSLCISVGILVNPLAFRANFKSQLSLENRRLPTLY